MAFDHDRSGWFRSSYSGPHNNNCIEARFTGEGIDIRDSTNPQGPLLSFSAASWDRFLGSVAPR